jgi:hypothetical protein
MCSGELGCDCVFTRAIFQLHPYSLALATSCSYSRALPILALTYPLAVTGPVARFCRQIAGHGFICVAPSSYHEFTGPEPLKYDAADTDRGNEWKKSKVSLTYPSRTARFHILGPPNACSPAPAPQKPARPANAAASSSPPTTKTPSSQSPTSSACRPAPAALVPQACVSAGILHIAVPWIVGCMQAYATLQPTSTLEPLAKTVPERVERTTA